MIEAGITPDSLQRRLSSPEVTAVLLAEVDQLHALRDAPGRHLGDELLRAVAGRLCRLIGPDNSVIHLDGLRFVVICEDSEHEPCAIESLRTRIHGALNGMFALTGTRVTIASTVSVSFPAVPVPVPVPGASSLNVPGAALPPDRALSWPLAQGHIR